jgi:hypothetical protein
MHTDLLAAQHTPTQQQHATWAPLHSWAATMQLQANPTPCLSTRCPYLTFPSQISCSLLRVLLPLPLQNTPNHGHRTRHTIIIP